MVDLLLLFIVACLIYLRGLSQLDPSDPQDKRNSIALVGLFLASPLALLTAACLQYALGFLFVTLSLTQALAVVAVSELVITSVSPQKRIT